MLSDRSLRVIGVMPQEFQVPSWFPASTEAWIPLVFTVAQAAVRGDHNFLVVGRLRSGVNVGEAQSQMNVIFLMASN